MAEQADALAARFVSALSEAHPPHLFTDLKITRKGGPAAQSVKKIILSRLATSPSVRGVAHVKSDTYVCFVDQFRVGFRFTVTASPNALPWFNISFAELNELDRNGSILCAVWNSVASGEWCRKLRAFAVPPRRVLAGLEAARSEILQSLFDGVVKKVDRDDKLVPGLKVVLEEQLPHLFRPKRPHLSVADLEKLRTAAHNCLASYLDRLQSVASTETFEAAKYTLGKIRLKLDAILVRIHPDVGDNVFTLRHDVSDSVLCHLTPAHTTLITLAETETDLLQAAYGTSIEEEDEPEPTEPIGHPYDPTKTKIDTRSITVDLLTRRLEHTEIDLNPDFQRKAGLWTRKQKSQLIESLLIRIPLPSFYFDATNDSKWLVVDGLQRLVAFKEFMLDEMPLDGLEYLSQYNGKQFSELPRPLRRSIEESQVTIHLIQPGTPPEVKFNIFRRVNTGGLVLTPQEIRHALNQGPVVKFLAELAQSQAFLEATTRSIPTDRMMDREFVLRFLAFSVTPYIEYRRADMDGFLNLQMSTLNKRQQNYATYRGRFASAMTRANEIFGKHAFRKLYDPTQSRSPINKALFETWSVHLANLSTTDAKALSTNAHCLISKSIELNKNPDFNKAITQSTADVARVRTRFAAVEDVIEKTLAELVRA